MPTLLSRRSRRDPLRALPGAADPSQGRPTSRPAAGGLRAVVLVGLLAAASTGLTLLAPMSPAAAVNDSYQLTEECDDGLGGGDGQSTASGCTSRLQELGDLAGTGLGGTYSSCSATISDTPTGPIDTIRVDCSGLVDADLNEVPARRTVRQGLESGIVAGPGGPLGTEANPLPLPLHYSPPPWGPHVTRSVSIGDAQQNGLMGCIAGGSVSAVLSGLLSKSFWGTIGGGAAGCVGGWSAGLFTVILYKDEVRVWYPVVNGRPSRDPATWYTCTDYKVRAAESNPLNPFDVLHFKYPASYPDLGGETKPFARRCVKYLS